MHDGSFKPGPDFSSLHACGESNTIATLKKETKHYAMNDQETGRFFVNSVISKRAMKESDLLAFRIAISVANPSAVGSDANGPPRRLEWLLES